MSHDIPSLMCHGVISLLLNTSPMLRGNRDFYIQFSQTPVFIILSWP